jgi:polyribonucleotide nucleotidyltransferase
MPFVGVREFSKKVSKYIGEVERSGSPVIITRHGRPAVAVLRLDVDRLQALAAAAAPHLVHDFEQADADLAAGRSRPLDDLIAELEEEDAAVTAREHRQLDRAQDVELGDEYQGTVVRTTPVGAVVEVVKGSGGLLHISSVAPGRHVASVEEVLNEGDVVNVRVVEVDRERGRIGLRLASDPEVAGKSAEEIAHLQSAGRLTAKA